MALFKIFLRWGSPPRVRGKEYAGELHRGQRGITPACAGKRTRIPGQRLPMWDHPRVCGEKPQGLDLSRIERGSPPRVRGKADDPGLKLSMPRITPACAGKRQAFAVLLPAGWDHPRVCGEKTLMLAFAPATPGSPPRVRGKGIVLSGLLACRGITPACAGKSLSLLPLF